VGKACWQTDAEVLVFVIDSDMSEGHSAEQREPCLCRRCEFDQMVQDALANRNDCMALRWVGVALAVPQLEAWGLAGRSKEVGEAEWGRLSDNARQSLRLKSELYGADRVLLPVQIEKSRAAIAKVLEEQGVDWIANRFPYGFGEFAKGLRENARSVPRLGGA